jgi:hypothetical protein
MKWLPAQWTLCGDNLSFVVIAERQPADGYSKGDGASYESIPN